MPLEVDWPTVMTASVEVLEYIDLEVALDSGAGVHVVNKFHIPGHSIVESVLSKAGGGFIAANGDRIPNSGEALLQLLTPDSTGRLHSIKSSFEVADVTRPLWSVGVICDQGLDVVFNAKEAKIIDERGQELCYFTRKNCLYLSKVGMKNPLYEDFHGQG